MTRDPRLARLSRDHHHALTLALRIQRELVGAEARDVAALGRDALRYWEAALVPHLAVEARALHPPLAQRQDDGLALAGRAQREQRELARLADEVREASAAARAGVLARFGTALAGHVRWEEHEVLEWAQAHVDGDTLDAVAAAVAHALPAQAVPCPVPHIA